jgi:hypothetical protein
MIKALETKYKGYRFRSRLESRYAVYFDCIGIEWVYEPQGFVLEGNIPYLPDFWLNDLHCFAEVKPETFSKEALQKINLLCKGTGFDCILLEGVPQVRSYKVIKPDQSEELVILFKHPSEPRLYRCAEEMDENQIEMDSPEIFPILKRAVDASLSSRFEFENSPGQRLATPQQQLQQEQLTGQSSGQENPLLNKPCTKAEIDSYSAFAALPISERRRRVYANYITQFPHSLLTKDVLSGKIDLPKPRKKRVKDKSPKRKSVSKKAEQMLLQIEPAKSNSGLSDLISV